LRRKLSLVPVLACLALLLATDKAAALNWDPQTNHAALSDGSGVWDTGPWWNGTVDQAWTSGSNAAFGAGTSGSYSITLNNATSAAGITFRTSGYTVSGPTLTMTGGIITSNNASATISNLLNVAGNGVSLGTNSTLTLAGGYSSTSGNPGWAGANLTNSVLAIIGGTSTFAGACAIHGLTVNHSAGVINGNASSSAMYIGYTGNAIYNLSGTATLNSVNFGVARQNTGTLNMTGGAIGTRGNFSIGSIAATDNGTANISAGTVICGLPAATTLGVSSASLTPVGFCAGAVTYTAAAGAVLNFSGGTIATKGLLFGNAAGVYTAKPTCRFSMSGGLLYVDSAGIASANASFTNQVLTISGGIIAATANWTGSMPMTLTTTNGNITFQSADLNGNPWNIALSGALSGTGGLNKTGNGNLTLSGIDSFSGASTVNSGQFIVNANGATSIGTVSLVNSGTTLSSVLAAAGKSWTNAGLALTNGVTADFNFGGFQASPSSRVIQVNGNLTLDSSDSFTIEGTSLIVGTFPLMTCTGTLTLNNGPSLPAVTSTPGGVTANLSQSGNTIYLVVTASPNSPLNWGASASGPWDFSTTDWVNAGTGSPTNYLDGLAVNFNDNTQGAVAITLNSNVQPISVTANNNNPGTATYTIAGNGSIGGNASVVVQGTGTLALATSNTYVGGTIVNSGTLAINNGGDGSGPSAIGEGTLTLNAGAALDNTSGSNITLNSLVPESWNGNFTFVGTTNLDLGSGTVTLGASVVQVTVQSNMLTYDGSITDGGLHYALALQGAGTLTLTGDSTFTGGMTLNSGKLNINSAGDGGADSAIGFGAFNINGGTIDTTAGSDLVITTGITEFWNASFTFAGTHSLDLGPGTLNISTLTLTLQNGATLSTEGTISPVGSGALATITLNGNGTFKTSGNRSSTPAATTGLTAIVNSGVLFQMDRSGASGDHSVLNLTVNTNGTALITGTSGHQIGTASTGVATLSGGTLDLNGNSEGLPNMTFNSGTLQNSSNSTAATLAISNNLTLKGSNCVVDVTTNSSLSIPGPIISTGSLVKIDAGTLNLGGTNTYTGSTTVSNGLLSFTTATLANRNYTVAGGELEAILDPADIQLQMTMSTLTFATGTRMEFDLASGAFGDTTSSLVAAGSVTMNGNVAVDVTNAPADANDDVLLSYASRSGPGDFVAGSIPVGAFIYDNTAAGTVTLTYTQPPPQWPSFTSVGSVVTGGSLSSVTFTGIRGTPGGTYHILSSANVALRPLSSWTPVKSGSFDSSGSFTNSVTVNPAAPQTFYILIVP
jgi:autotransporter-associated beta strand protein